MFIFAQASYFEEAIFDAMAAPLLSNQIKKALYRFVGVHSTATGVRWDLFYSSQQEMMFGPHHDL